MTDTILLKAEYDDGDAKEKVIALRKEILSLKAAQTKLNADWKAGRLTQDEYVRSSEGLSSSLKVANKEVAATSKQIENQSRIQKSAEGSVDALRAAIAQQTVQWNALSAAERKEISVGGVLQASIKEMSDQVKEASGSVGNFKDNVGNYSDAFEKAEEVTGLFGFSLEGIKGGLEKAKTGLEAAKLGLTGLKGAIAATGIGILILAFGALITFLTKSQAGMDLLSRKLAGVSAVVSFFTQKIAAVGGQLVTMWDKPGEAVKAFGDFVQEQLTNRFKAFGVILQAIKDGSGSGFIDGVAQLATGVTDASKKAKQLAEDLNKVRLQGEAIEAESQSIARAEQKLNVERSKTNAIVAKLKMIADDTTKSTQARIAAATKAGSLEINVLKQEEALQQRRIKNAKAEAALNGNRLEDTQKIAEAQAALAEIQTASTEKQTEIQNTRNGLIQEGKDKAIEAAKAVLTAELATLELRRRAAEQLGQGTIAIQEAIIAKQAELDKKDAKTKRERDAIDAKANADIADARIAAAITESERFLKIEQSRISAKLSAVKKGTEEEADLLKEQVTLSAQQDRLATVATIKNAKEQAARLVEIDAAEKAQKLIIDNNLKAKIAQNDVTAIQARLNAVRQGSAEEFTLRAELLDAQKRAELENVELTQQQITEIKSRYAAAQQQLEKERLVKESDDEILRANTRLNNARAGSKAEYEERTKIIKEELEKQKKIHKDNIDAIANAESVANKALRDLDEARFNKMVDDAGNAASQLTGTLSSVFQVQSINATKAFDAQLEAALKSAGNNSELRAQIEEDFEKKRLEIDKEGAKRRKRIAQVEAAINTAVGATKAFAQTGVLGFVSGALIVAAGLAQQALISAQEFAQGGVYQAKVDGPMVKGPGGPKDDRINAKLSNGEAVMTARAVELFGPILSMINQAGGGRAFPATPSVSYGVPNAKLVGLHYGGFANGGVANSVTVGIDESRLAAMIGSQVTAGVDAALRANPMYVSVQEMNTVQTNVKVRQDRHLHRPSNG